MWGVWCKLFKSHAIWQRRNNNSVRSNSARFQFRRKCEFKIRINQPIYATKLMTCDRSGVFDCRWWHNLRKIKLISRSDWMLECWCGLWPKGVFLKKRNAAKITIRFILKIHENLEMCSSAKFFYKKLFKLLLWYVKTLPLNKK